MMTIVRAGLTVVCACFGRKAAQIHARRFDMARGIERPIRSARVHARDAPPVAANAPGTMPPCGSISRLNCQ